MDRKYNFPHRMGAWFLLASLFLQSCNNSSNQLAPTVTEPEKKERKKEVDLISYQQCLEFAIYGDSEAQFRLGQRAYEAWQEQNREDSNQEARVWLRKAALQGHQGAIALLEEMDLKPLSKDVVKKEEKEKEAEKDQENEKSIQELEEYNQKDIIVREQLSEIQEQEKIELPSNVFQTLWQISQTTGGETYRDKALECLLQEIKTKETLTPTCYYFQKLANLGTINKLIIQAPKFLSVGCKSNDLLKEAYLELDRLYREGLAQIKNITGNSGEREFAKLKLTYHYYRLLTSDSSIKGNLFKEMQNMLDELDLITNLKVDLAAKKRYIRYLLEEAIQLSLCKNHDIKQYIEEVNEIADATKNEAKNNPQEAKELRNFAGKLYCKLGNLSKDLVAGSGLEKSEEWQHSYYLKAKKLDNKVAYYRLGELYENQFAKRANLRKAKEYYVKAANQGYVLAEYKLALLQESEGKKELAFDWYKRAAKQGHPEALYKLYQLSKQETNNSEGGGNISIFKAIRCFRA